MKEYKKAVKEHDRAVKQSFSDFIKNMEPLYEELKPTPKKPDKGVDMAQKGLLCGAGLRD